MQLRKVESVKEVNGKQEQSSDSVPDKNEEHPNQDSVNEESTAASDTTLTTESTPSPPITTTTSSPSAALNHHLFAFESDTATSIAPVMTGVKVELEAQPVPVAVVPPEDDESATLVTPPFIAKLSSMLENAQFGEYIHWNAEGDTVIVKNLREFANVVIPKYFKHNNFASFLRQLNMYYFSTTRQGQNWREFKNPLFCKDNTHMHKQIKRKGNVSSSNASSDGSAGSQRTGARGGGRARAGARSGVRAGMSSTGKRQRGSSANSGVAKSSAAAARRKQQQQAVAGQSPLSGGLGYAFSEGRGLCVDGVAGSSSRSSSSQWAKKTPLLIQDVQGLWQKLRETRTQMSVLQQVIQDQQNVIDKMCAQMEVNAARSHQQQQHHSFVTTAGNVVGTVVDAATGNVIQFDQPQPPHVVGTVVDAATGNVIQFDQPQPQLQQQQPVLVDPSSAMGFFDAGSAALVATAGVVIGAPELMIAQLGGQKKQKTGRRKASKNVGGGAAASVAGSATASSSRRVLAAAEAAAAAVAAVNVQNGQQQQQQHLNPYMLQQHPHSMSRNVHAAPMMVLLPNVVGSAGQPVLSVPHHPVVLANSSIGGSIVEGEGEGEDEYLVDAYGDTLAEGFSGDNHSPSAVHDDTEELEQASAWFTEGSNDFGDVMFD